MSPWTRRPRGEVPGVGRVVDGECAARDSGGGAPLMLSELPDTAPVDVSVSAAQETAPEASTPVVKTSVQFTSLRSSWSQPTLPCAVSPSSVAKPVRASESASRSVTETDSPSKALALIFVLYRSSVPADCCASPGIDPPKAPKCSFAIPPGGICAAIWLQVAFQAMSSFAKRNPFSPFLGDPFFGTPCFFCFFLALQRLARLKCNLEPNCKHI